MLVLMDSKLKKWRPSQISLGKLHNKGTMISLSTSSQKIFSHFYLMLIRISNMTLPHPNKHFTQLISKHLPLTNTLHAMIVYITRAIKEILHQLLKIVINFWDFPNVNQRHKNRDLKRRPRHLMLINTYHFLQSLLKRKFNPQTKRKECKRQNTSKKHF